MKRTLLIIFGALNITIVHSQDKLVNANNYFAFKIYNATKPDTNNFFISPFSLNVALSIANEGAKTTTRDEMDSLLSIHDILDRSNLYNDFIIKTTNLKDSDFIDCTSFTGDKSGGNELYLANSLWINQNIKIDSTYKKTIQDNYYSEIFEFNANDISSANEELNSWIFKNTNNKIRDISGLNKDIMLSIINAIYFMGEWNVPFDKKKTKERKFHTIQMEKIDVDFMKDQSHYDYFEDDDIQCISLPYKCDQFSMKVILPKEKYGIDKIEDKLNSEYFREINSSSNFAEVILSLPKFKIESEILPIDDIKKMGYREMFSDNADFTRMSRDSLKIGNITHKTFIEIDEKKTEAAAVSKIDMYVIGYGSGGDPQPPPPPKIFNADHPFIFLIIDNRTKAIIFMGRFVK